jgi:uncharacterized surface protein with fasciclin (FAS1) repeats
MVLAVVLAGMSGLGGMTAMAQEADIVDIAAGDGRFSTLVTAVEAAGLVDTLKGDGPFTVFAPTDDAFAALPEGALEGLLADTEALTNVLLYHVVPGRVMAADVVQLTEAQTAQGQPLSIRVDGDTVHINNATVIITDIEASNGVIHVIDTVLLPPTDEAEVESYTVQRGDTLWAIAQRLLGNGRRFPEIVAATNAANATDPSFARITDPNRIFVGWKLALPAREAQPMDIVDIAVADGRFETLVAAVQAAGLVDTLKSEGPFTVFAPTDEAFAALPEGTVAGLLEDIPALTNILLYHVVPGRVMAADVVQLDTAQTALEGQTVSIRVENGNVFINDAQVIITDIEASNGVIHVIDTVLLPPAE